MADQLDRLGGRNGEIWRAYASGRTQEWIAQRHSIDQSRVSQIIATVRESLPDDAREDWRTVALETLLHLHAEMAELANGEPTKVYDDDGVPIEVDHSNRLAATDRVIKLQDRAAKMLGTDAPERVEASVTQVTQEDIALAELVREARAQAAVEEAALRQAGGVAGADTLR